MRDETQSPYETQAFFVDVTFKCYGADKTATADPFSPALCTGP